ncbi:MAG TPA: NAD(P)-dependent oxidoreductase [Acidimicrobiales bacterium]|nr:NAD(P)-dependent oxidoreductase [Acidimicrobiales bacterium]
MTTAKPVRPVTTVGVIGLGDIGRGVADAVLRAGLNLVVCDLRPEATAPFEPKAHVAGTPVLLGARADVVVVSVVDDRQVLGVLDGDDGALAGAEPGSVVVVLSTVAPATVEAAARSASRRDVDVVDCGVSGGPQASADGTLVAMVGGEAEVIERVRPVLDTFTSLVVHMGPLGAGLKAKLARNLVQYGSWLAAYEAQVLAEAAGIELAKLAEVIRESDKLIGGASRLMFRDTVAPMPPDTHPGIVDAMAAGAALAHKDLQAAIELGRSLGLELPLARMTDDRCDAVFGLSP